MTQIQPDLTLGLLVGAAGGALLALLLLLIREQAVTDSWILRLSRLSRHRNTDGLPVAPSMLRRERD